MKRYAQITLAFLLAVMALCACENNVAEQYPLEEEVSKVVTNLKKDVDGYREQINNIDQTNKKLEEITNELKRLEKELKESDLTELTLRLSIVAKLKNPDSVSMELFELNNSLEFKILSIFTAYGVNLRSRQLSAQMEDNSFGTGSFEYDNDYYYNDRKIISSSWDYGYTSLDFNKILERCFASIFNVNRMIVELKKSGPPLKTGGIVNRLKFAGFKNDLQQLIALLESNRKDLINRIKVANIELSNREKYLSELQTGLRAIEKQRIDKILLIYVLPGFGVILLLMIYLPRFYNELEIKRIIFEKGLLLQLITVFLLTISILILGIGDKINSEVLGTLLGGISVYVLQTARQTGVRE